MRLVKSFAIFVILFFVADEVESIYAKSFHGEVINVVLRRKGEISKLVRKRIVKCCGAVTCLGSKNTKLRITNISGFTTKAIILVSAKIQKSSLGSKINDSISTLAADLTSIEEREDQTTEQDSETKVDVTQFKSSTSSNLNSSSSSSTKNEGAASSIPVSSSTTAINNTMSSTATTNSLTLPNSAVPNITSEAAISINSNNTEVPLTISQSSSSITAGDLPSTTSSSAATISSTALKSETTTTTTTTTSTITTATTTTSTTTTTTTPTTTGVCQTCSKNMSLFESDGHLRDRHSYGSWIAACGYQYLFGKSVATWKSNYENCCALGMVPIMVANATVRACLNNITKPAYWKYNFNYWTAGNRTFDNNTFQWCPDNATFDKSSSFWANGHPKLGTGPETCVHLNVNKMNNRVELTSKNCSNLFVFGCQGPTTPSPPCYKPECPNSVCTKKPSYFSSLLDGETQYLTSPNTHGVWKSVNGRSYMFSASTADWQGAVQGCCSIGMKLLSVDYEYETSNLIRASSVTTPGEFWTSGSDTGCDGFFGWCAVNKLFRDKSAHWAPGEPSKLSTEHCVSIALNSTSAFLKDSDCALKFKYICEARDTTVVSINSDALLNECCANFNVTKAEVESIMNMTELSTRIKCFIKCMGEQGGFMLNGQLIDEEIIKLAEEYSTSDSSYQENMEVVAKCSPMRGMDECDTASLIYKCGQTHASEYVDQTIYNVVLNNSIESVPLQGVTHKCIVDYVCKVDPVLQNQYINNLPTTGGSFFTACGTKYFVSDSMLSYQDASSLCCKYGLRTVSLTSANEIICIVDSAFVAGNRKQHHWLAATRLGHNQFGWCTANYPYDMTGLIDAYPDRSSDPLQYMLSVRISISMAAPETHLAQEKITSSCRAFCKP